MSFRERYFKRYLKEEVAMTLSIGSKTIDKKTASKAFSGLSALLLLSAGPLSMVANAQVFSSQRNQQGQTTPSGQVAQEQGSIQTTLDNPETLYLDKRESYAYDLVVRNATTFGGRRLPVGAVIRGQFQPAEGGLFYVAETVELADRIYPISAVSQLIHDKKDPRETSAGAILTDAAIGAAGGYVLGEVLGNADFLEVLGGAAAGVVVGNTTAPFVVVIKPDEPIVLYAN